MSQTDDTQQTDLALPVSLECVRAEFSDLTTRDIPLVVVSIVDDKATSEKVLG